MQEILREGHNCWCRPKASRAAVLIDGESYYAALADAIERAEHSILMVGWDFHSRVRLRRDEAGGDSELLPMLERAVRRKRGLRVHILAWDFAMIYALEREWLPLVRFEKSTHRRISFRLDDCHPFGASQHQKIVVVDDALAFSGGLDVTACRWDTREHRPGDPRRNDPGFEDYGAFHDAQIAVDGDAARALAELVRERWQRATGETLRPVRAAGDVWPAGLLPDFRDVSVGISRTLPGHAGRPEVREVEALWVDAIAAAKRTIYLENQYLTSHVVGNALAERLAEPEGPEVVAVLPSTLSGWLEEITMGVLSARIAERLREADQHGRLRLLQPRLPGGEPLCIHAKLMVVDDRLLRIGSANTSNRSMGFDSECDLSIEATPEQPVEGEIRAVRDALLAEHLGCKAEDVADALRREGGLAAAVDRLAAGERSLEPLDLEAAGWVDGIVPDSAPFDPETPVGFESLWERFQRGRAEESSNRGRSLPAVQAALALTAVAALLAAWQWTPLAEWVTPEALAGQAARLEQSALGTPLCIVAFALATSLLVPVTALITVSGMVFGFVKGAAIALAGSLLAAALGYAVGHHLWRDTVRRMAGSRLDRISRRLGKRGVVAAGVLRLVPVAPFGVVNLVAGASHIRARDFLLGTAIGMAPGIAGLAFFGDRALAALRDPGAVSIAVALSVLILLFAVGRVVGRRLEGEDEGPA